MILGKTQLATLQDAAAATANGTHFGVPGLGAVAFQVTGTFSATVTFEGTVGENEGGTWVAIRAVNQNDGVTATTATAAGLYLVNAAGLTFVRARVSAYVSGSVTVVARSVAFPSGDTAVTALAANSGVDIGDVDVTSVAYTALTYAAPTSASVGTSTTVVLAANASRKWASVVNDSANVVYLAVGNSAVLNTGIRLNANGGSVTFGGDNLTTQAINGISGTAASVVTVQEAT